MKQVPFAVLCVLAHVEGTVAEPFLHRGCGDRAGHDLDASLRGLLRSAK